MKTMTEVLRESGMAEHLAEGAELRIGPETAALWGVEQGRYKWLDGKAVRLGDWDR